MRRCAGSSELNQLKSDFLDTAQHELRTPVLAIQGQIELLNVAWDKWDDATKLEIVRDVDISVKLLGETVENVVDFALVNSDTIDVRMSSVDVAAAISDAANDVRRHFKDGLPVELTVDVRGSPAVNADPFRLRQVLRALIDNAVKFTPEGGHVTRERRARSRARAAAASRSSTTASASAPRQSRASSTASTRRTTAARAATAAWAWDSRWCAVSATRTAQPCSAHSDEKRRQHVHDPLAAHRRAAEPAPAALFFEPVPSWLSA